MVVSPMATAPNMRARWDMDLSPGTLIRPLSPVALREIRGWDFELVFGHFEVWIHGLNLPVTPICTFLGFDIPHHPWHGSLKSHC